MLAPLDPEVRQGKGRPQGRPRTSRLKSSALEGPMRMSKNTVAAMGSFSQMAQKRPIDSLTLGYESTSQLFPQSQQTSQRHIAAGDDVFSSQMLSQTEGPVKKKRLVTCSRCKQHGHYRSTCKALDPTV